MAGPVLQSRSSPSDVRECVPEAAMTPYEPFLGVPDATVTRTICI
jgi:hypothetical protein